MAARKAEGHGVLVAYLPAGFPTVEESVSAAIATLDAGADILEFGVPYSDPVMDGVVIAEATQKALENGFKLKDLFPAIRAITDRSDKPVLVMTYWNPVVQYGVENFARDLKDAGGAGLITPDLIPDEAAQWAEVSERYGLEAVFLAAPTSTDTCTPTFISTSASCRVCASRARMTLSSTLISTRLSVCVTLSRILFSMTSN
ncbi:MAG: tryptophan synthase subunit alpha, partial [Pontimonas sp.]|nr:tryptophan synthase subunit alpha [Pontimonas sp.]